MQERCGISLNLITSLYYGFQDTARSFSLLFTISIILYDGFLVQDFYANLKLNSLTYQVHGNVMHLETKFSI